MSANPWLDFTDEFTELIEKSVEERDFFLWSRRNPPGTVEIDRETEVRNPDSLGEMFCDECGEFEMRLGGIGDATYCGDCWDDLGLEHQGQLGDFETEQIDGGVYALVQCGSSKKDGTHPARELYDSTYFEKKREFADELTDEWWILSAKYGVLDPDTVIEDYDTTVDEVDTDTWLGQVEHRLTDRLQNRTDGTLWVLVGTDYLETTDSRGRNLRRYLTSFDLDVRYPFRQTNGIGEQQAWLDQCLEYGDAVMPYVLAETHQQSLDSFPDR